MIARPTPPPSLAPFAAALALAAACGVPGPRQPAPGAGATPVPPAHGAVTVELPGPPAAELATDGPGLEAADDPDRPFRSPCLDRAAAAHLVAGRQLGQHPAAFTERAVDWAGCPDGAVTVVTLTSASSERAALAAALARLDDRRSWTHFGAASEPAPGGGARWLVLLTRRRFELRPVPSSVEPGGTVALQLRIAEGLRSPSVLVTRPGGDVVEIGSGSSGGTVVAALTLEAVGRHWVEVLANGEAGPEVLALFPVEVGRAPPRLWVGEIPPPEPAHPSPAAAEAFARRLLAEERGRFGLRPLAWDPALVAVARDHSRELAAEGRIAHLSERTGSVVDRLRVAGYRARFASENLAQATAVRDAHDALMRSPGHRAAILDPHMTDVGIGVAWLDHRDYRTYFLTQVFTRPWSRPTPAALERAVGLRLAAGRPYDGVAADAARDVVDAGVLGSRARASRISRRLADAVSEPLRFTLLEGAAFEAGDVRLEDRASGPAVVGVGFAAGEPPAEDAPAPWVAVVLERP